MNKIIIGIIILVIVSGGWFLMNKTENNNQISKNTKKELPSQAQKTSEKNTYKNISATKLSEMLNNKDFLLVDVHIPEQEHIPGTDYMIAYDEVDKIAQQIPNKDAKIVVYCRSGGMSKMTAQDLADKGYKNVYNLEKGLNEWKEDGKEVLPKGSVKKL